MTDRRKEAIWPMKKVAAGFEDGEPSEASLSK